MANQLGTKGSYAFAANKNSTASNISQLTYKEQRVQQNVAQEANMRKELYASHITDKTIELTPVFQRTQDQVRTKPLLENDF